MPASADVVVIGAGVVGCSVAYYLAREGVNVTILERESIGSGASAHATGSLSLLGAEFSPGASFEWVIPSWQDLEEIGAGDGVPTECERCGKPGTPRHQKTEGFS